MLPTSKNNVDINNSGYVPFVLMFYAAIFICTFTIASACTFYLCPERFRRVHGGH
jgi:hypothetical protein